MSGRPPVRWSVAVALLILALGLVITPPTTSLGQDTTPPPTDIWQTYDDTDPRLLYENGDWETFTVSQAAGGTLTGTASPGATLTVYFWGTGIRVLYSKGPEGGVFKSWMDGYWLQQVDNAADSYSYGHVLAFEDLDPSTSLEGLPPGQHRLVIATVEDALWIEAIQVQGTLFAVPLNTDLPWTTFQDTDVRLTYGHGPWEAFNIASANGGTLTGSTTPGALLIAHFEGTGIRVLYSKGPEGNVFTAQIDDGPPQTADSNDASYSYSHALSFTNLAEGNHVLTLTNGDGAIWIEAFEVQGTLLAPPPQLIPILPTPTVSMPTMVQADSVPVPLAPESAVVVEDYVVLEAATTADLVDLVLNRVNLNPDQHHLIRLTSDSYTILEDTGGYSGMPVRGHLTIIGENGLDENGNSLTPNQVAIWNTIERSSSAPDIDLFNIAPGASLTLYNVRLVNGGGPTRFSGGGIVNGGELYVYNSQIVTNHTNYWGGGIHNDGTLVVVNSEFIGNTAEDTNQQTGGGGSAIINYGSLTATCTTFKDNHVSPTIQGGSYYVPFTVPGGAIYTESPDTQVHYSNFIDNTASGQNPYCSQWPQYGFCPLHIRDFASTVPVDASNNYWSNLDDRATWGEVTTAPTIPEVHYGDYAGEGEPCFVPQVLRAPLEITKALASPIPFINEPAEFIIAVSNQYTTTQENIEIVDWLPEGLTYVPDSLVIPDGSTVTLNEDNEVVWTVDALEVAQSYELQFAVSMSGELLGQEIVNTTRVESINGEPATEMEDNTTFVPVMCEGGLKPDRDEINVRDNPNLTDTEVVYQLTADETVGVIGITFSPEGAEQGHPWWYRIVIPVEDDQEEETPSDEPEVTFVFGWITGSFFASECENTPLLDRYGHLVPLPHQSSDQQLAFTGVVRNVAGIDDNDWVEYKVYSIAQIADKTNWSGNNPPITPITTLPTGTPVIISAIHPNRQYVRVRYLTEDGELTTAVDDWIRARITTNQNYPGLVIIPYDRSSLNDATPIALVTEETIENIINDEWERDLTREMIEALVVDPDDPNDDSQVVLPICRSENWREGQPAQVFNCRPAQVCDYIFGCGESLEVRLLNEFLDTEEGCGNNRCNGGCRAWLNQVNGTGNWHCGVDLVTHMDAECGYGDRRGVYMVHGGLYSDFTENTYKFRYRDAENQLIWEYNYTHLPSSNVLGSNQRGQYVATGIKIGDYGPYGMWGHTEHVHYVEKVWLAPDHDRSSYPDTEYIIQHESLNIMTNPADAQTYSRAYSAYDDTEVRDYTANLTHMIPLQHPSDTVNQAPAYINPEGFTHRENTTITPIGLRTTRPRGFDDRVCQAENLPPNVEISATNLSCQLSGDIAENISQATPAQPGGAVCGFQVGEPGEFLVTVTSEEPERPYTRYDGTTINENRTGRIEFKWTVTQ